MGTAVRKVHVAAEKPIAVDLRGVRKMSIDRISAQKIAAGEEVTGTWGEGGWGEARRC